MISASAIDSFRSVHRTVVRSPALVQAKFVWSWHRGNVAAEPRAFHLAQHSRTPVWAIFASPIFSRSFVILELAAGGSDVQSGKYTPRILNLTL